MPRTEPRDLSRARHDISSTRALVHGPEFSDGGYRSIAASGNSRHGRTEGRVRKLTVGRQASNLSSINHMEHLKYD